jgi:hypothetical protein
MAASHDATTGTGSCPARSAVGTARRPPASTPDVADDRPRRHHPRDHFLHGSSRTVGASLRGHANGGAVPDGAGSHPSLSTAARGGRGSSPARIGEGTCARERQHASCREPGRGDGSKRSDRRRAAPTRISESVRGQRRAQSPAGGGALIRRPGDDHTAAGVADAARGHVAAGAHAAPGIGEPAPSAAATGCRASWRARVGSRDTERAIGSGRAATIAEGDRSDPVDGSAAAPDRRHGH